MTDHFIITILLACMLATSLWFLHEDNKTLSIILNNKIHDGR